MITLLCWYCAVQGIIVNGLVPSAISSIERRFKLSTSTMGRIVQVIIVTLKFPLLFFFYINEAQHPLSFRHFSFSLVSR